MPPYRSNIVPGFVIADRFSPRRSRRESSLVIPIRIAMLNSVATIEPGRHCIALKLLASHLAEPRPDPSPFLVESLWTTFATAWGGSSGSVVAGRRVRHDTEPPPATHH